MIPLRTSAKSWVAPFWCLICLVFAAGTFAVPAASLHVLLPSGSQVSVPFVAGDTVAALKQRLQEQENIPGGQQRLLYAGTALADERTLESCQISAGQTLQLVWQAVSGAWVLGAGGGIASAGPYALTDTDGQLAIGGGASSAYAVVAGFWADDDDLAAATLILPILPSVQVQPTNTLMAVGQEWLVTATVTGTPPFRYQWRQGGGVLSGQTNVTLAIVVAGTNVAGNYDLVVTSPFGSVTSQVAVLTVNRLPVGVADTLATRRNAAVQVAASKLARNDRDPDSDPLSVTAVSPASHGTVQLDHGMITYTPMTDYVGPDGFDYTVSDGRGGTVDVAVHVTVEAGTSVSPNIVHGPAIEGSDFVVRFAGIPGVTYTIESTDHLESPVWLKQTNLTAPLSTQGYGAGIFEFREGKGAAVSRYYRVVYPAY
jgi:hypothetical protein